MYVDIISCKKTSKIEELAKKFNLSVFSLDQLKPLRIIEGKNDETIRRVLEYQQADILLDPHQGRTKDSMHYRNSGLNQVLCELARRNRIFIGISLEKSYEPKELGKIMQNIRLCKKYSVPILFFSLAKNEYGLRNPKDIISFCKVLGMTPGAANYAVAGLEDLLKRKNVKY